jgi:hypothetical protein
MRQEAGDFLTFGDMRFLMDYAGRVGGSAGLGHRIFSEGFQRTFGGYLYADVRNTDLATFTQVSGGLETLGQNWDLRMNFYAPTAARTASSNNFTPIGTPFLGGNNIFAFGSKQYNQTMAGFETTLAVAFPWLNNVRMFTGPYYFTGAGTQDALGARAGVDVQWQDYVNTNLQLQTDRVFGTNLIFGLSFAYSGNRRNPHRTDVNVRNRLADSVEKLDLIVVDQQQRQNNYAFTDPATGKPFNVLYVAQQGGTGGDGTFEHPFGNLSQAQAALLEHDILVVENGTYLTPLTLPRSVTVLGDDVQHVLTSQEGAVVFPLLNPGSQPTIFNVGGAAITLDNNDVVSGIFINGNTNNSSQGIVGSGADNVVIDRNVISNTVDEAIKLGGPKGTNFVTGNTIINGGNDAIQVSSNNSDTNNLFVTGNTVNVTDGDGVKLNLNDVSVMHATVTGNIINGATKSGILVQGMSGSGTPSTVDIAHNVISNDTGGGSQGAIKILQSAGTLDASIHDNLLNPNNNGTNGMYLAAEGAGAVNVDVARNNFIGTYGTGMQFITQDGSSLKATAEANVFTGTYTNGVMVANGLTAGDRGTLDVSITGGNQFLNPTGTGVFATQLGTGAATLDVSGNTFSANSGAAGNAGVHVDSSGSAGSQFNATVQSNNFYLSAANVNGVSVTTHLGSNVTANISSNMITGTFNDGVLLTSGDNSSLTATVASNMIGNAFNRGVEITSSNFSFMNATLTSNSITGGAFDGMIATGNDFSNLTLKGSGNMATGSAGSGFAVVINDNANGDARFTNNPNLLGNAGPDLAGTTNGGVLFMQAVGNAVGGDITFTNNAGLFNVFGDPVALNPGATVVVGPGVNINQPAP